MTQNSLVIRSADNIRESIRNTMQVNRDDSRWNEDSRRFALQQAVLWIGERLRVPFPYEFESETFANSYTLPGYVTGPMDVQVRAYSRYQNEQGDSTGVFWDEIAGYRVVPGSDGAMHVEFPFLTHGDSMRVIYWDTNPFIPAQRVRLAADLGIGEDDNLALDLLWPELRNGYVKVGSEIVRFQGATHNATTTLNNLTRGMNSTQEADHVTGDELEFCVAAHAPGIFQVVNYWAIANLHSQYLNRASEQERDLHDMQYRTYLQLALDHMRMQYQPMRSPRMRLTRGAVMGVW